MIGDGRRRTVLIVTVGLLAAVAVSATSASAQSATSPSAADPSATEAAGDPCPGDLVALPVAIDDAPTMCTHGPDPGVTPNDVAAQGGASAEAAAGIECYGTGTNGPRVQLLYAYASSNRFNTFRPVIEQRAAQIDAIYDASAQQTGGRRFVRWLTDANCNLDVRAVQVPAANLALSGFGDLMTTLDGRGYNRPDRKYLVWTDTGTPTTITSGSCSGVGTLYPDERPSRTQNYNNLFPGYTRVDDKCLFALFNRVAGKVEAHELMHTLGAVQGATGSTVGAPHRTPYGHCTDDYDIMCYADGPGVVTRIACSESSNELRFDCNHDDYFSTNPRSGSYLDTHWNTADSSWLEDEPGAPVAPGAPQSVAGAPGDTTITLSWAKPQSDGGATITQYRVYRNGTLVSPATTQAQTSYVDRGLVNGQTYRYEVSAVNGVGAGPRSTALSVIAGVPRPDALVGTSKTAPFVGDGVYFPSMDGNPQVISQPVARGASVSAFVRVQNDRAGADSFQIKGEASGSGGYTVRYYRGRTDITDQVVAGTYTTGVLAPGATITIKLKTTAGATAGARRSSTVTVTSRTTGTIRDVVQARAVRT